MPALFVLRFRLQNDRMRTFSHNDWLAFSDDQHMFILRRQLSGFDGKRPAVAPKSPLQILRCFEREGDHLVHLV